MFELADFRAGEIRKVGSVAVGPRQPPFLGLAGGDRICTGRDLGTCWRFRTMGMLKSVATLHEIITPATLAFLVHAMSVNRRAFVFIEGWSEMFCVGLGFCECSTWYGGKPEPED